MRVILKLRAGVVICAVLAAAAAGAQSTPMLHARGETAEAQPNPSVKGYSTLPGNASGEYEIDDKGSVAQITIEHNRLTGYITKMEQGAALTLFFDHAAVAGNRVSFETRTVHGLHYSFRGDIMRGDAISPSMTGYFRLAGELKIIRNGALETEQVSFKSTPRESGAAQ